MPAHDTPYDLETQIEMMKKYVTFSRKTKLRKYLSYTGYFRLSRYGKLLLSFQHKTGQKQSQEVLFKLYAFDVELRKLMFFYCKKAEVQFKQYIADSISLHLKDPLFYLDKQFYTPTKGEKSKVKRKSNLAFFNNKFYKKIKSDELELRKRTNKHPELKEYRNGGTKKVKKIPSWAAFSYFEFGTIVNMFSYLRLDLRKQILEYGYTCKNYSKKDTKNMDTWLDAIRNLRNTCAHHAMLVGKTSSIVLFAKSDCNILSSQTDFMSRLYALKKVLNKTDSENLKKDLDRIIKKAKIDIFFYDILPSDWQDKYNNIKVF